MDSSRTTMRKVGFLGIGAQKCATSWLHDVLLTHPNVATSQRKELNYFTANYERGAYWYEDQFDFTETATIAGEFSPNYFLSKDAVERAFDYNPDFRLIALLRDPVERAFSNHLHEIRKKHIAPDMSFEEAMHANPAYVSQGQYRARISEWLEVFPKEQLLVLLAEDISADPATAFNRVAHHLGVSADIDLETLSQRSHESIALKSEALQKTLRMGGDLVRKAGAGAIVTSIKAVPGISTLLKANKLDLRSEVPKMKPQTWTHLTALFKPDMEFVMEVCGVETLPWASWQGVTSPEKTSPLTKEYAS